ncbi:MAG TPA: preprotein translocase subunit SecG [Hyphomicrobiales bacterium]|nr:preprotein translocase subunit SecG [Hyphomicrobiales bacterium]
MQTVIIVIHLMIVLALVVVVLLQRSEGGALGIGGGGGFMSGRAQANALTRATAILAGLFFITSVALAWLGGTGHSTRSIFDTGAPATTAPGRPGAPQVPTSGGVLQMLKPQGQGQVPTSGAGAPTAPAPAAGGAAAPQAPAAPAAPAKPAAPTQPEVPTSH